MARDGIGNGLSPYAPDGIYPEGPTYWSYGTSYQVLMIAALESALGIDWGMPERDGFLDSAGFVLQAIGPSGRYYNFADGRERGGLNPAMFWFARKLGDPEMLLFAKRRLDAAGEDESGRFSPFVAIWWPEAGLTESAPRLPLRWHGRGENPLGDSQLFLFFSVSPSPGREEVLPVGNGFVPTRGADGLKHTSPFTDGAVHETVMGQKRRPLSKWNGILAGH
jgi:hypothetical protein